MYSDDPVRDYNRYDTEREEALEKLPVCACCGEHIQDDYCYEIDEDLICPDCMENYYRRNTDDFID